MTQDKIIYLDNAAATPLDPMVKKAMEPFLNSSYGNPSSLHQKGIEAKGAVDKSRKIIAKILNGKPEEIIFTAGGTESNNLAIFGVAKNYKVTKKNKPHIITSLIEHSSVIEPCRQLEKEGFAVTYLKVSKEGFVEAGDVIKALRPETILVSIMYANNEIGTIQPIAEIGKLLVKENVSRQKNNLAKICFHSDACQAAGALDINVQSLGVDLMTINGSKIYGPKQSGFLFVRNGCNLKPLIFGGGQEKALRSGTENVAGIVGLAKALELSILIREKENKRLIELSNYFVYECKKNLSNITLNGPVVGSLVRLPNNVHFTVQGVEGESLMLYLDAQGICISTGSACDSNTEALSNVLLGIGKNAKEIKSSIRITLGKFSTKKDLEYTVKVLVKAVSILRKAKTL